MAKDRTDGGELVRKVEKITWYDNFWGSYRVIYRRTLCSGARGSWDVPETAEDT